MADGIFLRNDLLWVDECLLGYHVPSRSGFFKNSKMSLVVSCCVVMSWVVQSRETPPRPSTMSPPGCKAAPSRPRGLGLHRTPLVRARWEGVVCPKNAGAVGAKKWEPLWAHHLGSPQIGGDCESVALFRSMRCALGARIGHDRSPMLDMKGTVNFFGL